MPLCLAALDRACLTKRRIANASSEEPVRLDYIVHEAKSEEVLSFSR
jgi:hypothetical protein